jgi:hypothetical protein
VNIERFAEDVAPEFLRQPEIVWRRNRSVFISCSPPLMERIANENKIPDDRESSYRN